MPVKYRPTTAPFQRKSVSLGLGRVYASSEAGPVAQRIVDLCGDGEEVGRVKTKTFDPTQLGVGLN